MSKGISTYLSSPFFDPFLSFRANFLQRNSTLFQQFFQCPPHASLDITQPLFDRPFQQDGVSKINELTVRREHTDRFEFLSETELLDFQRFDVVETFL